MHETVGNVRGARARVIMSELKMYAASRAKHDERSLKKRETDRESGVHVRKTRAGRGRAKFFTRTHVHEENSPV